MLLADLELSRGGDLPLLALLPLTSDTLRETCHRLPPTRRICLDVTPSISVLHPTLPNLAYLGALKITDDLDLLSSLKVFAAILRGCNRLVVLICRAGMDRANQDVPDDLQWLVFEKGVNRLVVFDFRMTVWGGEARTLVSRTQVVGPPSRQWTVMGEEKMSSLVPGTCQNLEYLGIYPARLATPTRSGFFSSLAPFAPSLRKDRHILDLLSSCLNNEELDLADQPQITDAAPLPLLHHRPLKVLGISCYTDLLPSGFHASAVTNLLTAGGSRLEYFDVRGLLWPSTTIFRTIGAHTPHLAVLTFEDCPNLRATHWNIRRLKLAVPALRMVSPLLIDPGMLPEGVRAISFGSVRAPMPAA
ncbi:hypothetical protein BDK51DRAFT_41969, partial [Blyttiomyces helicus]